VSSRISQYDEDHIKEIMDGHGDWFAAQILRLCAKADRETLEQLRAGFPDHVELFEKWRRGSP
jgi:hypothetical protein